MADPSLYIKFVADALLAKTEIQKATNGQIIPNFNLTSADDYLKEANHCCIGIHSIDLLSTGLPGVDFHGMSDHVHMIAVDILQINKNDTCISGVAKDVANVLKKPIRAVRSGINYYFSIRPPIRVVTVTNPDFPDRVQITITTRLRYLDE